MKVRIDKFVISPPLQGIYHVLDGEAEVFLDLRRTREEMGDTAIVYLDSDVGFEEGIYRGTAKFSLLPLRFEMSKIMKREKQVDVPSSFSRSLTSSPSESTSNTSGKSAVFKLS